VAALHQGAPDQMTWLKEPPPWLCPAYCFTISDRFIYFILTVKQSAALTACVLRASTKKACQLFGGKKCTPEKVLAMPMPP